MLLESLGLWGFIAQKFTDFLTYTGFANVEWANIIMILVGAFFIWLAIKKDFEPLLLIPIGLGIILGIFFGIISALYQNSIWDTLSTGVALFGISMPMFWQGLMLILLFSVILNWLPPSGYGTWQQMIMPVVALGVNSSATIMRTTRSSMLEVMRQDYIRTAKAKGQKFSTIVIRHALHNAMIPIITVIGLQLSALLAGSIVTEVIFSISGVGRYLVDSMTARDYAAVQGCVILIAFVSAILNLIVDIIYTFIDPRMKTMYESAGVKLNPKKLAKAAEVSNG